MTSAQACTGDRRREGMLGAAKSCAEVCSAGDTGGRCPTECRWEWSNGLEGLGTCIMGGISTVEDSGGWHSHASRREYRETLQACQGKIPHSIEFSGNVQSFS